MHKGKWHNKLIICVEQKVVKSIHGHDAFLIETNQISDIFIKILK